MAIIAFGMQAPIVKKGFPIAVPFAFTVVAVQGFALEHEAFTIGYQLLQQSSSIKNRRKALLEAVDEVHRLEKVPFAVKALPLTRFHVVDERLHKDFVLVESVA